jgi:hypothetical protein
MSPRKPLAALTAVTAAAALAVPASSASAATPVPGIAVASGRLAPGSLPCQILIGRIRFAAMTGNTAWANTLSTAFIYSGCGGAAI